SRAPAPSRSSWPAGRRRSCRWRRRVAAAVRNTRTRLACTFLGKGRRRCQPVFLPPAAGRGGEFATSGEQVANSPVPLSRCASSTWDTSRGEFASSALVPGPDGGRDRGGPVPGGAERRHELPSAYPFTGSVDRVRLLLATVVALKETWTPAAGG